MKSRETSILHKGLNLKLAIITARTWEIQSSTLTASQITAQPEELDFKKSIIIAANDMLLYVEHFVVKEKLSPFLASPSPAPASEDVLSKCPYGMQSCWPLLRAHAYQVSVS